MCHPDKSWKATKAFNWPRIFPSFIPLPFSNFQGFSFLFFLQLLYISLLFL